LSGEHTPEHNTAKEHKMLRTHTAIALIAALGTTPALGAVWTYDQLDTDSNQEISTAEWDQATRQTLTEWDTNSDGLLSASEFETHHAELGIDITDPIASWDTSGDGSLDQAEFSAGAYDALDADNNQMIAEEEVASLDMPETGQAGTPNDAIAAQDVVELGDWAYDPLYADGVSVDRLIGHDVLDSSGDDIGQVENVLIAPDGQAVALIAEVGGLWELGDTHISIPWDEIEVTLDGAVVPVTEETVDDYSLFRDNYLMREEASSEIQEVGGDGWGEVLTGPRVWRATELIGDYARLIEGEEFVEYGLINDIILKDGQVAAAVVSPDLQGRAYAYPYYGWTAGSPFYDLPYDAAEADTLEPFDYDQLESSEPAA